MVDGSIQCEQSAFNSFFAFHLAALGLAGQKYTPPHQSNPCALVLAQLARLQVSPDAARATREYPAYGSVAQEDGLQNLPEGRYVYLIERNGDVIWSPAVPIFDLNLDDETVPVVVSHRSLAASQLLRTRRDLDVVAAGEFVRIDENGSIVTQEANNRSATYSGGADSLKLAVDTLMEYGLEIDERTLQVDFSQLGLKVEHHVSQQQAAIDWIRFRNSPELWQLQQLAQVLLLRFPRTGTHSLLDLDALTHSLGNASLTASASC